MRGEEGGRGMELRKEPEVEVAVGRRDGKIFSEPGHFFKTA